MDMKVTITTVLMLLSNAVVAKRYCKMNSDCSDLGDLECVKSMCDWGVCGCPHGKASKFLGTSKLFQCVTVKKVGEKCSNDGNSGVCGAQHAYCDEDTHRCTCYDNYVPVWGGERCANNQNSVAGETCSSAIGSCELDSGSSCSTAGSRWHPQVMYGKPTCACLNTQTLRVTRRDFIAYSGIMPYVPAIEPGCYPRVVDDICIYDDDCMGNAACVSNKCACNSGYTSSYDGTTCKKALVKGAVCSGSTYDATFHCDGTLGLVCGDQCYIDVEHDDTAAKTCECGPYHTLSGSSCAMRAVGSACYGDFNCKGISAVARCVDGKCKAT